MNKRLQALLAQRETALNAMRAISTQAGDAALSAEQQSAFDAEQAKVTALDADIARERALIESARNSASAIELRPDARIESGRDLRADNPTHGFASLTEFVRAVHAQQIRGVDDERLRFGAAATTYGNESSIADGGFLVPPEYATQVWMHSLGEDAFLPMCDGQSISGNTMSYPKDETTPWGTDGIRAYWENEAAVATQTKPKGEVNTLRLKKLMALIPVTDELQSDGIAVSSYVSGKAGESIRWKTNLALFAGSGVGQPEGIFSSAARVDVAKESGQAADTVVAANVAKMFARQINPREAVWLINPMVLPQLIVMTIGQQPIWTPPQSGMAQAPLGFLLGRPIMSTQVAKILGDVGDIGFVNWRYQRAIQKAAGIEAAQSMHLFFDQNMSAWRFTFRVDAKPVLSAAVSPANGSDTLSPFVFLADRA